jgi:hypothetical protein
MLPLTDAERKRTMKVVQHLVLPVGVTITYKGTRTLLRVPAALALLDESPLPSLVDALLVRPGLQNLDVQVYERVLGEVPMYALAGETS